MSWLSELRTRLTGVDPGLARLQLAAVGTASAVLAAVVMAGVRALTGQPVTIVLFAVVLATISSLAVNEPDIHRLRVTTALVLGPAVALTVIGTLLVPYHIVADVVFVLVTVAAVYVRRFGARGFALGLAGFNTYFFTQFLHAVPAQLPWLLLAVCVGVASTLLLRGLLFAERPEHALARQLRAFTAHLHGLVDAVADLLTAASGEVDPRLRDVHRRLARLNETALLVSDTAERLGPGRAGGSTGNDVPLRVLDAELAAERLAVATERLVAADLAAPEETCRELQDGLRGLLAATATGTPPAMMAALLESAERSVAPIVDETQGQGDRVQRVAFAVKRLAEALSTLWHPTQLPRRDDVAESNAMTGDGSGPDTGTDTGPDAGADTATGLRLTTRQAIQVGVAASIAIVAGELVSPARWYWAVITAFLVFAGTSSRGDVLSRGWGRIIGTIGGVFAGVGLAALGSGSQLYALMLLFGCLFLALYLVRVSPALMAFWVTALLALLYGLIGQFSVATLVLRVEETAVGAVLGVAAAYLVLPKRSREAFAEALDGLVDAVDAVLAATVDGIRGRGPRTPPLVLARTVHDDLIALRTRVAPLDSPVPWRRGRSSYHRTLRVLSAVDHYARSLARISSHLRAPEWTELDPAAERVRSNLDALRRALLRRETGEIRSAEDVIDAAESAAARRPGPHRTDQLVISRLLRRIDQAVVALAHDLGLVGPVDPSAGTRAPTGAASTR